jgi:hypothetical protein
LAITLKGLKLVWVPDFAQLTLKIRPIESRHVGSLFGDSFFHEPRLEAHVMDVLHASFADAGHNQWVLR